MTSCDRDHFVEAWNTIWHSELELPVLKEEVSRLLLESSFVKHAAERACQRRNLGRHFVDDLISITAKKLVFGAMNIHPSKIANFIRKALANNANTALEKKRRRREADVDIHSMMFALEETHVYSDEADPNLAEVFAKAKSGRLISITLRDLWEAISRLEEIDSMIACVAKLKLSENTIPQIARLLNIDPKKAKRLYARAVYQLRSILESIARVQE